MFYKLLIILNLGFYTYKCQVNLEIVFDSSPQNYQIDSVEIILETLSKKNLAFFKKSQTEFDIFADPGDSVLVFIEGYKPQKLILSANKNIVKAEPIVHLLNEVVIFNPLSPKNVLDSVRKHLKKNHKNIYNISYLFTEVIVENSILRKETNIDFLFNTSNSSYEIINVIAPINDGRICYNGTTSTFEFKYLLNENPVYNNLNATGKKLTGKVSHLSEYVSDNNSLLLIFEDKNIKGSILIDKHDWSIKEYNYSVSDRQIGDIILCCESVSFSYTKINEQLVCSNANRLLTLKSLNSNCSSTIKTSISLK